MELNCNWKCVELAQHCFIEHIGWLVLVIRPIASTKDIKPAKTNLDQSGFEPVPSKSSSHPDAWFIGVHHLSWHDVR